MRQAVGAVAAGAGGVRISRNPSQGAYKNNRNPFCGFCRAGDWDFCNFFLPQQGGASLRRFVDSGGGDWHPWALALRGFHCYR
jgi:hypothetical protein